MGVMRARPPSRSFATCSLAAVLIGGCAAPRHTALAPPPPTLSAAIPGTLWHTVQPGETLWSIGQRYGVSHQEIMRQNRLSDPAQVPVGQVLVIPKPAMPYVKIPLYANPQWTHIVVHHSATTVGNAKLIDRAHRKRGFSRGMGYHVLINNGTAGRADGQIEIGSRWLRQQDGAHCNAGGMNHHGIGICLVGDFTSRKPSPAQLASLVAVIEQLRAYYRIPKSRVIRHLDVIGKATACPGDAFPWAEVKARLSDHLP